MKFSTETILKLLLVKFAKEPMNTLAEIVHRFLPAGDFSAQVQRMRAITDQTPLILQVETTNVCNSACTFCAYTKMTRKKGVMSLPLFEQIIAEYAAMGGGSVSLTPLVGDALLDPHLIERLQILDECPQTTQISLTTNAIAFERYTDNEIRQILETMDCIQISIGGLDESTYMEMFGVNKFAQVQSSLERLLKLKDEIEAPPNINLAFRTNDWRFELRYRQQIKELQQRGVFVSHIWSYANYAGLVEKDKNLKLEVSSGNMKKDLTCIYSAVHMAIGWDGRITACGCADFEGTELRIGQLGEGSLGQVWAGAKRRGVLDSFANRKLHKICRECSAYKSDSAIFSNKFCKSIKPHRPLPKEYFQRFWGG